MAGLPFMVAPSCPSICPQLVISELWKSWDMDFPVSGIVSALGTEAPT